MMKDTLVVPEPPTLYVAIVLAPLICISPALFVVCFAPSKTIRIPVAPTGCPRPIKPPDGFIGNVPFF